MKMCAHIITLAIKMGCMDKFLKFCAFEVYEVVSDMKYKPSFTALVEGRKAINTRKKKQSRGGQ